MSTIILCKKRLINGGISLLFFLVVAILFYAQSLANAQRVEVDKSFYFLATKDERVEVGAEFAKLDGGAGYLWENGGKNYVVLSVYRTQSDGEQIRATLAENGKETELIAKEVGSLYFKGGTKKKSALYLNALRTFDSYISLLEECISRLERGSSQESCKRLLSILKRQFAYSEKSYKDYGEYARVCKYSKETLSTLCKDTLFAKDLRHLLCWQAEKYLELASAFSL